MPSDIVGATVVTESQFAFRIQLNVSRRVDLHTRRILSREDHIVSTELLYEELPCPEFEQSSTPMYCCLRPGYSGGVGNIFASPNFVSKNNNNYHLLGSSPCIDKGYNFYLASILQQDVDGECRLVGSSVDIGCDEFNSLPDVDGDLLSDADEISYGTSKHNADTDSDSLLDGVEILKGTSPLIFNEPGEISIPSSYTLIQEGIFYALAHETIYVDSGIYDENLLFLRKELNLISKNPSQPEITTISGGNRTSAITLAGTETKHSQISKT